MRHQGGIGLKLCAGQRAGIVGIAGLSTPTLLRMKRQCRIGIRIAASISTSRRERSFTGAPCSSEMGDNFLHSIYQFQGRIQHENRP